MSYTFQRQASDLRDKVYGILGLTKYWWWETKIPVVLLPDYTKSVQRVAQDLTLFMIRESNDLRVLQWIDHGDPFGSPLESCSWCIPLQSTGLMNGGVPMFIEEYKGVMPSTQVLPREYTMLCTNDLDTLQVLGFQIGVIVELSKSMPWELLDPSLGISAALSEVVHWLSTLNNQARPKDFLRTLARTLTAGLHLRALATEQEIDVYEGLLKFILDQSGRVKEIDPTNPSHQELNKKGFLSTIQLWSGNRKILLTQNGMLGL